MLLRVRNELVVVVVGLVVIVVVVVVFVAAVVTCVSINKQNNISVSRRQH